MKTERGQLPNDRALPIRGLVRPGGGPTELPTSWSRGREGQLVSRSALVGALATVLIVFGGIAGLQRWSRYCEQVDAALAGLQPQEDGDLSLTRQWSIIGDGEAKGACTTRVSTTRSGAEVVAYYRADLQAHGWRVSLRPEKDFEGQCSSGRGQCHGLQAFGKNVCLALTTDTVRRGQALSADRTTLFFFAAPCRGLADWESRFS